MRSQRPVTKGSAPESKGLTRVAKSVSKERKTAVGLDRIIAASILHEVGMDVTDDSESTHWTITN